MPYKDREAQRAYNIAQHRRRYAADKQSHIAKVVARKNATKAWLRSQRVACMKCGESHPACLDFHHRDSTQKKVNLARAFDLGREKLEAELAKCDVLCSNCHRKAHWKD